MPRIRTIKPEFWSSEPLAYVSAEAQLLAIGLLNFADDEGYFNANPKLVESFVFPIRELSNNITVLLRELSEIGYIALFTGDHLQDGRHRIIGHITNFEANQVINKKKASEIKKFVSGLYDDYTATVSVPLGKERKGKEGKGKEGKDNMPGAETSFSSSPKPSPEQTLPNPIEEEVIIELHTNRNNQTFKFTATHLQEVSSFYPAVDCRTEINKIAAWLYANPTKRKTAGGMLRFVNNWLSKAQDRAMNTPTGQSSTPNNNGVSHGQRKSNTQSALNVAEQVAADARRGRDNG
ncbi:hypothetical protein [Paraferrimonas sedimenticola]|uniref:DnaT DNA-binding domain-containing protein n=1 Tax=Paraferrimonas sedimenticola TaxID=375674 RepID=A0AA37RUC1_9GAMM|nr:hypothetical protein [Paraferrimonas sedimenticola]GLP95316.1 hypothetical protein GCM10007895_06220 [Paraferrimonas sedimenticola]